MRVELEWTGGVGFTSRARHFDGIIVDEPPQFHGNDRGPSSVEYLGIAVGGCLGSSLAHCLHRLEVEISSMSIEIDLTMHHVEVSEGFKPLRVVKVDAAMDITLQDVEDKDVLELCIESFRKYCVVSTSVAFGIPIDVTVK